MRAAWRCTILLAICLSARAEISHLRRVDENVYYAHQPKPQDYATLAHMGIRTVLDLRGGWIHKPHERREVEAAGMRYISIRLSGIWAPKDRQIARILAILDDPSRVPVFVHCRRGDDRVGTAIACYHIVHDHWTNKQALQDARHNGLNVLEVFMQRYISKFDVNKLPRNGAATAGQ